MNFQEAFNWIVTAKDIVLTTHTAPDVDGISSMLAFWEFIKRLPLEATKQKRVILLLEEIPKKGLLLPHAKHLKKADEFNEKLTPELLILFDAHSAKRINEKVLATFCPPERVIIFDHHQREDSEALSSKQIEIIYPDYPSTTAVVYQFFKELNITISFTMATNLLAGLYYDTGGFRYENTTPLCFQIAHALTLSGANAQQIANLIFSNRSLSEFYLLREALKRFFFLKDGKAIITYLTKEDFETFGKELNDIASFFRDVEGVKLSVLIKELERDLLSVSLRSKPPFACLPLAKEFGGGGHIYACGFKVRGKSLKEILEILKEKIEELDL